MPETVLPFVRVVVLNWNSAWFTRRCLRALAATEYPTERYEVVLVDNASVDGSLEQICRSFPGLRIVANEQNLGFAEGCNRAMRDLDGVDAVALVNNDAVPEPGWLAPLVSGLDDAGVGAVAARLVLEPAFTMVEVEVAGGSAVLDSVQIDRIEVLDRARMTGVRSVGRVDWPMELVHHVDGGAVLRVPAGSGERQIDLRAHGDGVLSVRTGRGSAVVVLGATPTVVSVPAGGDRDELLNGLGTDLGPDSEGRDLYFGEPVEVLEGVGPETVTGFCGGGVLLRSRMLREVGVFDPMFFAYYEDTDLSWRARSAGWRTVTAPASVIRHAFGGSAGSATSGFFYLNYRNWMMTVLRNADAVERRRAAASAWARIRWAVRANLLSPLKHRRRPDTRLVGEWSRVLLGTALAWPYVRRTRRGPVGACATDRVRSRLQPTPAARPARTRPGGPRIVYVDMREADDITRGLLAGLADVEPRLDVVPVVGAPSPTGLRRATPTEVGRWLGVDGPHAATGPEALWLSELAHGSAVLRREGAGILATPAESGAGPGTELRVTTAMGVLSEESLHDLAEQLLVRFGTP